jgi:ABC-type glycerol-3-phosphate transport system permease component
MKRKSNFGSRFIDFPKELKEAAVLDGLGRFEDP